MTREAMKQRAADVAADTGGDPARARIYEGVCRKLHWEFDLEHHALRECPGCREVVHAEALSCGRCGWEF